MGRRLWDDKLFHLRFLAIICGSGVLTILLLCDRELSEGLLNKVVIIFVIIIFIRTLVEWLNIVVCAHSSDWWQDDLEKSPVSGYDS